MHNGIGVDIHVCPKACLLCGRPRRRWPSKVLMLNALKDITVGRVLQGTYLPTLGNLQSS